MMRIRIIAALLAFFLVAAALSLLANTPDAQDTLTAPSIMALQPGEGDQILNTPVDLDLPESIDHAPVQMVEVNLSQIASDPPSDIAGPPMPELKLKEEIESPLSQLQLQALREAAMDLPEADIEQVRDAQGGISFLQQFDAMDINDCCGNPNLATVPPDPEIAVGPNHVIEVVNIALAVYSKSGNQLTGPVTFAALFAPVSGCNNSGVPSGRSSSLFDPNVLYDESTGRYIIAIDRLVQVNSSGAVAGDSFYCVAVSQTADPTGSYYLYAFPMDVSSPDGVWMDYPQAGIGRDALYMGGNLFTTGSSPNFVQSRVWAIDKAAMYNGNAASFKEKALNGFDFTPQPLHLHGFDQGTWPNSGAHSIFAIRDFNSGNTHTLYHWTSPFGSNTLSQITTLNWNAALGSPVGFPVPVPQSGGQNISANDWRPQDFEYRNGSAFSISTVACNPGGGTVDCTRWIEINPTTGAILDAGLFASTGVYRVFGDLAVNACDEMAMGYTRSNSGSFPATWVASNSTGTMTETSLKSGEVSYTAFDSPFTSFGGRRWGDYTGMTIAPDGITFWYVGQYSKNTGNSSGRWGTYIGSFMTSPCVNPGDLTEKAYLPAILD